MFSCKSSILIVVLVFRVTRQLSLLQTVQKLRQEIFRLKPTTEIVVYWVFKRPFFLLYFSVCESKTCFSSCNVFILQKLVFNDCHRYAIETHTRQVVFFRINLGLYQFARHVIFKYQRQIMFSEHIFPTPEFVFNADKWKTEKPILKVSF